jgi:lipid II:glycine glycyltransferase (peptidoglycan interpeptide bridge formation enzyme)
MKERGCLSSNLNGINPQTNPGTYVFKQGLAGKSSRDVYYLGRFDSCPGPAQACLARAADSIKPLYKKIKSLFGERHCRLLSGLL